MSRRERLSSAQLADMVLDAGSWVSWDVQPEQPYAKDHPEYAETLAQAQAKTGLTESLISGEGKIRGRRVAVISGDFAFLAGSIGVAAAERFVEAMTRATAEGLPVVAAASSGGTRMQEGTVAFLQMVKITQAVAAHREAGLPYLVYLRHPTTGGVFASWGSLGHVTVAEPEALVGFLGPRVYEALYDQKFPEGVQTSENLYQRGLIDGVIPPQYLAELTDRALNVLTASKDEIAPVPALEKEQLADIPAWDSITISRRPDRPGVRSLLSTAATDVLLLNGTGEGENAPGMILALAKFGQAPAVVLGQDRFSQMEEPMGPASLRAARRGMRLAVELSLPLVTVVDTPGAALSKEAEEGGMAGEIARSLLDLVQLNAPSLCLLLGEGTGGGALALLPADRVLCAQHGWLSPLPPEGASAILYRTVDRAPEIAAEQGVRSLDLLANGIVDRIIAERPDAADEPDAFLHRTAQAMEWELTELMRADTRTLREQRWERYRKLGQ